jgi:hypothetical protein
MSRSFEEQRLERRLPAGILTVPPVHGPARKGRQDAGDPTLVLRPARRTVFVSGAHEQRSLYFRCKCSKRFVGEQLEPRFRYETRKLQTGRCARLGQARRTARREPRHESAGPLDIALQKNLDATASAGGRRHAFGKGVPEQAVVSRAVGRLRHEHATRAHEFAKLPRIRMIWFASDQPAAS